MFRMVLGDFNSLFNKFVCHMFKSVKNAQLTFTYKGLGILIIDFSQFIPDLYGKRVGLHLRQA